MDGVYTADPRVIPAALKHSEINCDEMLTLARCGAQVLHDRSVELAREFKVNLEVLSSMERCNGTRIVSGTVTSVPHLAGVTRDQTTISVVGSGLSGLTDAAARLFQVLGDAGIAVYEVGQSDTCIHATVNEDDSLSALRLAHRLFFEEK